MRSLWTHRRADLLALAILFALITLRFADILFAGNVLFARDVAFFYYPMKHVLREIVLGGNFPFWNPYVAGGMPLAAHPESEVWYLPQWLILLPNYRLGFHLHVLSHFYIAAAGMFVLLRSLGARSWIAFIAALTFISSGAYSSLLNLFPYLFAISWYPWVAFFGRRYLRAGNARDLFGGAVSLAMPTFIGEPTMIVQAHFLLGLYVVVHRWKEGGHPFVVPLRRLVLIVACSTLLSAAALLPIVDFARDTVRSMPLDYMSVSRWSFPPQRLAELVFPSYLGRVINGQADHFYGARLYPNAGFPFFYSIYIGLLAVVLTIAGLLRRVRGAWFVASASIVLLLLAFGDNTPLLRLLYDSGLFASVRFVEKFVLGFIFVAVVFSAVVLEELARGDERLRRIAATIAILIVIVSLTMAAVTFIPGWELRFANAWKIDAPRLQQLIAETRFDRLLVLVRAAAVATFLLLFFRLSGRGAALGAALIVVADLSLATADLVPRLPRSFFDQPPIAHGLQRHLSGGRIFHHAALDRAIYPERMGVGGTDVYWLMRNGMYPYMSARFGYETIYEHDHAETHFSWQRDLWNALIASLAEKTPGSLDYFMRVGNATVRFIPTDERAEVTRAGGEAERAEAVVALRGPASKRFSFVRATEKVTSGDALTVRLQTPLGGDVALTEFARAFAPATLTEIARGPNESVLDVNASGEAFLVASMTYHRHWKAFIDGGEVPIVRTNIAYQGIVVPAGRHEVRFLYRNRVVLLGLAISLATLMGLALWAVRGPRGREL